MIYIGIVTIHKKDVLINNTTFTHVQCIRNDNNRGINWNFYA